MSLPHFVSSCNAHRNFSGMRKVLCRCYSYCALTFSQDTSVSAPFEQIHPWRWLDPSPFPTLDDGSRIDSFFTRDLSISSLLFSF